MKMIWKIALMLLVGILAAGSAAGKTIGISCGAWVVYWDLENGLEDATALNPTPDRLIVFEALFGTDGHVVLEPQAEELLREMQKSFPPEKIWLSVVNDLTLEKGGYSNKDKELLRELLLEPKKREEHVRELTALAEEWQLKGLEIDYENIHEDQELWAGYTAFLKELHNELKARGIALRACLEWDCLLYTELPKGPEYSIMCYTLYGYHSGPGPKADRTFLQKVAELYRGRKDCAMALATGGFEWNGNRVEHELTEQAAEKALRSRNLKPERDPDSGTLHGSYIQGEQIHEIWYADTETLQGWSEILQEYGFEKFDLFRLGGNRTEDWNTLILSRQGAEEGGGLK